MIKTIDFNTIDFNGDISQYTDEYGNPLSKDVVLASMLSTHLFGSEPILCPISDCKYPIEPDSDYCDECGWKNLMKAEGLI